MNKIAKYKQSKIEEVSVSRSSENLENDNEYNTSPKRNTQTLKSTSKRKTYYLMQFPKMENQKILKRFSCALVGEFLRQGNLYVTDNYFAFYSNIFGYVTKLLIPLLGVEDITKEKTAKFIPNAIGIITGDQKHVFSSFIQREKTFTYLRKVWQEAKEDLDEFSDIESDSESPHFSEEELDKNQQVPDEQQEQKGSPLSEIASDTKSNRRLFTYLWYFSIFLIAFLFILSGILFYKVMKVNDTYSSMFADDGIFKTNPKILKVFREIYSKAYLSLNEFVDKNIDTISDVRKSLESLSTILNDEQKSA